MTDAEEAEIRHLARALLTDDRPIYERALAKRRSDVAGKANLVGASEANRNGRRGRPARHHEIDEAINVGCILRLRGQFRRVLAVRYGGWGRLSAVLLSGARPELGPSWHNRYYVARRIHT